ncbi:unnamed protein product, partial [Hermetia illucens]
HSTSRNWNCKDYAVARTFTSRRTHPKNQEERSLILQTSVFSSGTVNIIPRH